MEQQITGREIALFITMLRLWDAYLETDIHTAGAFELRSPGFGCDECSYTLFNNGQYEIEAWVQEKEDDDGRWELVQTGDIFEEVNV